MVVPFPTHSLSLSSTFSDNKLMKKGGFLLLSKTCRSSGVRASGRHHLLRQSLLFLAVFSAGCTFVAVCESDPKSNTKRSKMTDDVIPESSPVCQT